MNDAERSEFDVAVVPSRDRWNDFGYSLLVDIGIRSSNGTFEWLGGRFAIDGVKSLFELAAQIFTNQTTSVRLPELPGPFALLLNETKTYASASRALGIERATKALRQLHDVALLHDSGEDVPGWPNFFGSEVFHLAMIRSSESYFAMKRGAWALAGRNPNEVDARTPFTVHLKGPGPNVVLDFEFARDSVLRGRMSVLIGKNGSGKTTTLAKLARALADRESLVASFAHRPEVNQVIAFAHSASLRHFKSRSRRAGSAQVRTFSLDPLAARRAKRAESDTRLLNDIARAREVDDGPSLSLLRTLFEEEFPSLRLKIPVKPGTTFDYAAKNGQHYRSLEGWMTGGEQRRLESAAELDHTRSLLFLDASNKPRNASLGQLSFVRFVLLSIANAGPASVFLVDEPENFLHPNLISQFMRVLHKLLEATGSIGILATHSPFVVREVQSSQVHVLSHAEDGVVEVYKPLLQTLGANVANIASDVFGDDLPNHLFEDLVRKAGGLDITFGEALERFGGQLSTEALMLLRSRIEGRP